MQKRTANVMTLGAALVACFAAFSGQRLMAQSIEELKLGRHSAFEPKETARNPFWPVGWTPASKQVVTAGGKPAASPTAWFKDEAFTVSSISTGGLPLAMINGRPYGEGDFITMPGGTVQVAIIRDGVVQLRFEERTLNVGLRREAPKATPEHAGKPVKK